ncbi:MAG: peptidoglycan editing factor PgeF [Bacteroidia bacterium]|nr:peptidoglycan editing factor PgeF [Bacteroidia bacterium]
MLAIAPKIFSPFKNIIALQTTRQTSVESQLEKFGIAESNLASAKQIHDNKVLVASVAGKAEGYDAIITNKKNVFVSVATADCTPVLIYDSKTNSVAAIHAGWRGTVLNIVSETLVRMKKEFGSDGKNCFAFIGACIAECSFEVGAEVAEKFDSAFVRWDEEKKKHFVDLKKANKKQLLDFGIPEGQIEISGDCTVLNNDNYFSYRKEMGKTGRMISLIGITS